MLIHSKKEWSLSESAVSDEPTYRLRNRREFVKSLGLGFAGLALGTKRLIAATEGFPSKENPKFPASALKSTAYDLATSYNNFYEFGTDKSDPKKYANRGWKTKSWTLELTGLVRNPGKFDINDLVKKMGGIEQRIYRHPCVEAWSMVLPWDGFPLAKLVTLADPKSEAKYVKLTSFLDKANAVGQKEASLDWPYIEGLQIDETTNELAFNATGNCGKPLPNRNERPSAWWLRGSTGSKE